MIPKQKNGAPMHKAVGQFSEQIFLKFHLRHRTLDDQQSLFFIPDLALVSCV